MRIFPDTNVLVSAFASRGLCADLFRYILVEHELIVGEVVITELKRALSDRIKIPRQTVSDIERLLRDYEIAARPKKHLGLGLRDADDEWIIASACAGKADAVVTGDADILHANIRMPLRVFSPRDLWEYLRSGESG